MIGEVGGPGRYFIRYLLSAMPSDVVVDGAQGPAVVGTVVRINLTPVKGTALTHPDRIELTETGLRGNRRFFLVDERGELFSAPDLGPLVRIRAESDPAGERLRLVFPGGEIVEGPASEVGDRLTVDFYGRPVAAAVVEGGFSDAFSAYAERPLRLLRAEREGDGSDVHHLSLVSRASVAALGVGAGHQGELDARRFRMDLEIDGCGAYEEDTWGGRRVHVGEAVVRLLGKIPRCVLTTKDPDTGLKDFDTLREIARQRERIEGGGGLPFGMYAEVERPAWVAVGDLVSLED
jgi:uncharacterized protein YcbX